MLDICGIKLEGRHHSGLDDSKNIAAIVLHCITKLDFEFTHDHVNKKNYYQDAAKLKESAALLDINIPAAEAQVQTKNTSATTEEKEEKKEKVKQKDEGMTVEELELKLKNKQFLGGDSPTRLDALTFLQHQKAPTAENYPNTFAWWSLMSRFSASVRNAWSD